MEPSHRKMYPGGSSAVGVEDGLYTGGAAHHIVSSSCEKSAISLTEY